MFEPQRPRPIRHTEGNSWSRRASLSPSVWGERGNTMSRRPSRLSRMRSVLVSVKYRYCWVASGRDAINGFDGAGLLAAGLRVRSDTAVAGLFLEVIVRHIPGLVGSPTWCDEPSRNGFSRLVARYLPRRQGLGLNVTWGNPFLNHDESANIRRSLIKRRQDDGNPVRRVPKRVGARLTCGHHQESRAPSADWTHNRSASMGARAFRKRIRRR